MESGYNISNRKRFAKITGGSMNNSMKKNIRHFFLLTALAAGTIHLVNRFIDMTAEMKNILKIMLMMITIFTIAGSAVYAAEIPVSDQDQLITSSDWTEISNLQDEMKKEEPDATIDYDKALKVYVDCNLIKLQTADTKKLTSALESANYVWVIPFKMEKTYGMFTVAKGLPLREEAKSVLTKAEQEEVKNHDRKMDDYRDSRTYSGTLL